MKLKSFTIISRYLNRKNSSLAFWWIPVTAGKTTQKGREMDYYVDFTAKADYDLLFDEKGVMMLDYLGTVGKQYNPCAVAQYGLGLLSRYYQTKENKWKEKAMIQADWLIDQMRFTPKGIARLEYVFEYGPGSGPEFFDANRSDHPRRSISNGYKRAVSILLISHTGRRRH